MLTVGDVKSVFLLAEKEEKPKGPLYVTTPKAYVLTRLMFGDALTNDRTDAADLLSACVRASEYQLADESSTLQRARQECEVRDLTKVPRDLSGAAGESRKHQRREDDKNNSAMSHRRGAGRVDHYHSTRAHAAKAMLSDLLLKQDKAKGDVAARGEHWQHQGHDGGISGGQSIADDGGSGKR